MLISLSYKTKDYCIQLAKAQVEQIGRKAPPPPFLPFGEILGSNRVMWPNFTHWYFMHHWISHWWQLGRKAPPPPDEGKFFDTRHQTPFQAILSNFGFCGRKAPPDEGKFFDTRSIHFRQFQATLVFVAEKLPYQMRENFLTPDQSILGNFEQLWFLWQKSPPTRENFLTPDLSILGNFQATLVFVAEKPPPPQWGKIFWHQIYPFQAISSNFGFCDRNPPPPAVTSSVSCWPSGVNYFIPIISVRGSQGATHTSFEVSEQASFKGYFISLVVICVK